MQYSLMQSQLYDFHQKREHYFECFALKSPKRSEHGGWNLLILLRGKVRSEQNISSSSSFWLGELYKQVQKHLSLSTVISATIHSWRSDKSVLPITSK